MIELMVAVGIIGLAVGPLIVMLSSSNKANKASIYEEMATHYARELSNQLLRMDGDIAQIVKDMRNKTGNSSLTFKDIINNSSFILAVSDVTKTEPHTIPIQVGGNKIDYSIILSPLIQPAFKSREIEAIKLSSTSNNVLKTGNFWKIIITITWSDPNSGRTTPRVLKTDVVLHEV